MSEPKQKSNDLYLFWLASPFVALVATFLLGYLRANIADNIVVGVLSLIAGLLAVILFLAGPVIGVVKQQSKN